MPRLQLHHNVMLHVLWRSTKPSASRCDQIYHRLSSPLNNADNKSILLNLHQSSCCKTTVKLKHIVSSFSPCILTIASKAESLCLQASENGKHPKVKLTHEPLAFYSPWRQRNVEQLLDRMLAKVQQKVDSGITETPYKQFPLQEPAIRFAREHELAPELR